MLRSNNMARAPGRAFSSTYARLEKAAIAAARRNDALLLYVPDNPSNVLQFSAGYTPSTVGTPIGRMLDMQYGAPTLGPELLANGSFTTGTAGWAQVLGVIESVGGRLRVTRGTSTGGRATAVIQCTPGKTYRLSCVRYMGGVSSMGVVVATSPTSTVGNISSNYGSITGEYVTTFVATQATHWIAFDTGTGTDGQFCEYDSASVRELVEASASRSSELVSNGDFALWSADNPTGWALSFVESATEYATQAFPGMRLVSTTGTFNEIVQNNICITGKTYEVLVVVSACSGSGSVSNNSAVPISFTSPGVYRAVFTAIGPSVGFKRGIGGQAADFTIASISLKEVFGYHGLQVTAAAKPTLVRIPRKRGPELVINGGFDSPANWSVISTTISGGSLALAVQFAYAQQTIEFKPGASYVVSYTVTASSGPAPLALSGSGLTGVTTTIPAVVGRNSVVVTCVNTTNLLKLIAPNTGTSVTIDDVSVREVLEWSNAISLDGVDDFFDVTFRDYFVGGSYTFVGSWSGSVTGNSSFVLVQSSTINTNPLCCPLFVAIGSAGSGIFERGDTGLNGLSGTSYVTDALTDTFCVELLTTSAGGTGNFKSWTSGVAEKNQNYTHVTESLTTNKVTIGAAQRSSVSGFAKAIVGLLCWSPNAMPDADRKAIGRFAAYLVGKHYV